MARHTAMARVSAQEAQATHSRRSFLALSAIALGGAVSFMACGESSSSSSSPTQSSASEASTPPSQSTPTPVPPTATPSPPPLRGRIAFHRPVGQEFQIFTAQADGSGEVQLTKSPGSNYFPRWSPDGKKIAFIGDSPRDGAKVWVMAADGSAPRRVTTGSNNENLPVWHPSGASLIYVEIEDSGWNLFTISADGTGSRRLTTMGGITTQPSYSPDGAKIAFAQGANNEVAKIWVMNADGSNPSRLSGDADNHWQPAWSPDGGRIAFASLPGSHLLTMKPDGSDRKTIVDFGDWPVWSPDGNWLLFQRFPDKVFRLFAVPAAGGEVRLIEDTYAAYPSWGVGG